MNQLVNLSKLSTASFFDKETLQLATGIDDNSLYSNIKRWLRKGILIQLKRGLYVTKDYILTLNNNEPYLEFVANTIKTPSYISGEYVLQKYGMLTESVFSITSVSLKSTNIFQNKLGTFTYSNIKKSLLNGFTIIRKDGFDIKQATKSKALFDYLYFRLWRLPEISKDYLKSLRINLCEFTDADLLEFNSYIYLAKLKKLESLPKLLKEISYDY